MLNLPRWQVIGIIAVTALAVLFALPNLLPGSVLDKLPAEERQAIELAYFGGLTYRQVAVRLDQPEGTVKSRIRTGLKRMRADLVDAGIGGVWSES